LLQQSNGIACYDTFARLCFRCVQVFYKSIKVVFYDRPVGNRWAAPALPPRRADALRVRMDGRLGE
jgi:hypothetical protein